MSIYLEERYAEVVWFINLATGMGNGKDPSNEVEQCEHWETVTVTFKWKMCLWQWI